MRRAAVSIPSNVAEGQARRTTLEFVQFVYHAEELSGGAGHAIDTGTGTGFCSEERATEASGLLFRFAENDECVCGERWWVTASNLCACS